jgi:hypothetical protein
MQLGLLARPNNVGTNQERLFQNNYLLPIGNYISDRELDFSQKLNSVVGTMSWLDFDLAPAAIVDLQWALSDMPDSRNETVSVMFEPVRTAS